MISIKLKGFDKLKSDINKFTKNIIRNTGEITVSNIKESSPVDSGKLKNSFKVRSLLNRFYIISILPYALIQNTGGKIKITDRMRSKMWAMYNTTGRKIYKNIAISKKEYIEIKPQNYINLKRIETKLSRYYKNIKI